MKQEILKILADTIEGISSSDSPEELADSLFEIVDNFVQVEYSSIFLWDTNNEKLKLYKNKGFSENDKLYSEKSAMDRHPGWVFKNRKSLHIPDMSAKDVPGFVTSGKRAFEVKSRLWVPITTKDRSLGAFGFASEHVNYFTQEHIKVLELVCRLAGNIYASIVFSDTEKKYAESLKLAMQKIEIANNAQQNFIAKMSHEMRTPLNGIIGVAKLLEETQLPSNEQNDFVHIISAQSNLLLNLINDVLDISKIQSEDFTLVKFPFDLKVANERIIQASKFNATQKNINFLFQFDELIATDVLGDELRYSQILTNIINNAIKFTSQGTVSCTFKMQSTSNNLQQIVITIEDTGIGIDEDKIAHIFERFNQEDDSISRTYGGSGLGRYISKEIINKMDGEILVSSEKNSGTIFTIKIPFELNTAIQKNDNQNTIITDLKGLKVLLAEDNEVNILYIKTALEKRNALVTVAKNGSEAVEACKINNFDIILMDLQMPIMDGISAAKEIRTSLNIKTPIIAQSANTVQKEIQACYKIGVNDFLNKPFTIDQLISKIINNSSQKDTLDSQTKTTVNLNKSKQSIWQKALNLVEQDHEFALQLLTIFKQEMPNNLSQLEEAIHNNNIDQVNKLGHKVKSSFRYFEMHDEAQIALFFEKLIEINDTNIQIIQQNINHLNQLVAHSLKEINENS